MNQYLFFYLYGAYGATYAKGKGKTLKQGLKDAFDNYSNGIGGGGGTFKVGKEEFPKRIHSHFYIHRRRRNYRK